MGSILFDGCDEPGCRNSLGFEGEADLPSRQSFTCMEAPCRPLDLSIMTPKDAPDP